MPGFCLGGDVVAEISKLYVSIGAEYKDFQKGMAEVQNKLEAVGKKMTDIGKNLSLKVTAPIIGIGAGIAKAAMDLEATSAKYETVFAGMTDQADAFITKFKELTPATKAEARSMASGIQDLLVPMGFVREEATEMTGEFMHVIGALTNFNSGTHTAADVTLAMQAAMTGSYESLKRLGIQLDVSTVEQKAMEMGLISSKDEMTKQIAAQVMLAEVYAQSGDALKAYTEENLDAKTKMGLMKAELIDVAAEFGETLLPIINKVTSALRRAVEWFSGLSEAQKKTILIVGGLVAAIGPVLIAAGLLIRSLITVKDAYIAVTAWAGQASIAVRLAGIAKGIATGVTYAYAAALTIANVAARALAIGIAMILSPIGLIVLAIAAVVTAGYLLIKNWDQVKETAGVVIDWMTQKWEDFRDGILAIWNAITGGIKGAINIIIRALNVMIRGMNQIRIDVPDWVPLMGGKGFGFNIATIPTLADGGHTLREGLALVGEEGPELLNLPRGATVAPLDSPQATQMAGSGGDLHLHVGVLVADDTGLKKLERMLRDIRINEGVRIGVSTV